MKLKLVRVNTLFMRLFALSLFSLLASHVLTLVLIFGVFQHHPHVRPQQRPPGFGMVMGIGVELLAVVCVAWFAARIIARPIQQLSSAAAELGDNVDRAPLQEAGPIEARQAARAFNRMQSRLREQLAARGRFLAAVSHDLRTPLTRIRLRVERIVADETVLMLRADVAEMTTMLDATLDYLRGEAQVEPCVMLDIHSLVVSMAEDYAEQGFAISTSGIISPMPAHPNALRRALNNLIENALRYGKQANVACIERAEGVSITISDCGPGIPENELQAVFEPFYRLELSRNKGTGGVGLGLSIAREAIHRHGGTLSLDNAIGGGLVASIFLPRRNSVTEG
ncbi:MAG TPA: ATP-binding protein [Herbaspirillum sp.]|nr:ATP-binding protein [Herbaspirillum sp.]